MIALVPSGPRADGSSSGTGVSLLDAVAALCLCAAATPSLRGGMLVPEHAAYLVGCVAASVCAWRRRQTLTLVLWSIGAAATIVGLAVGP